MENSTVLAVGTNVMARNPITGFENTKIEGIFTPLSRNELYELSYDHTVWIKGDYLRDNYDGKTLGFKKVIIELRSGSRNDPYWEWVAPRSWGTIGIGALMSPYFYKVDEKALAVLIEQYPLSTKIE